VKRLDIARIPLHEELVYGIEYRYSQYQAKTFADPKSWLSRIKTGIESNQVTARGGYKLRTILTAERELAAPAKSGHYQFV